MRSRSNASGASSNDDDDDNNDGNVPNRAKIFTMPETRAQILARVETKLHTMKMSVQGSGAAHDTSSTLRSMTLEELDTLDKKLSIQSARDTIVKPMFNPRHKDLLDGWSSQVNQLCGVGDYDQYLYDIYDHYAPQGATLHPLLAFALALGGSACMYATARCFMNGAVNSLQSVVTRPGFAENIRDTFQTPVRPVPTPATAAAAAPPSSGSSAPQQQEQPGVQAGPSPAVAMDGLMPMVQNLVSSMFGGGAGNRPAPLEYKQPQPSIVSNAIVGEMGPPPPLQPQQQQQHSDTTDVVNSMRMQEDQYYASMLDANNSAAADSAVPEGEPKTDAPAPAPPPRRQRRRCEDTISITV